jgi:hypothetical protein
MRVYIAGRVTGLPYESAKAKFENAETLVRASGFNPVNPLKIVTQKADAREAMKKLVPVMLECDAILLLADWDWSEGAKIEAQLARYAGLKVIYEEDLT